MEYFRELYRDNQRHPSMKKLVRTPGKGHKARSHEAKGYEKILYQRFPKGPVQGLCRIAGLPKPVDQVE